MLDWNCHSIICYLFTDLKLPSNFLHLFFKVIDKVEELDVAEDNVVLSASQKKRNKKKKKKNANAEGAAAEGGDDNEEETTDAVEAGEDGEKDNEGESGATEGASKKKKKKKKAAKSGPLLPAALGVTGVCDSYTKYGQTSEPSIPVAKLFAPFTDVPFPHGEEQEHPGESNAFRTTSEELKAMERMNDDL